MMSILFFKKFFMSEKGHLSFDVVKDKLNEKVKNKGKEDPVLSGEHEFNEIDFSRETREQARHVEDEKQLEEVRKNIESTHVPSELVPSSPTSLSLYVKSHLPEHLKRPSVVAKFYAKATHVVLRFLEKIGRFNVEGREKIPAQGPCLLVANHTRFFDEGKLAAISGRAVKVIGADMHFDHPIKRFLMRKIGVIEVPATLSHLSREEKQSLMERVPKGARAYYQKVLDRDEKGTLERKALRAFLETTTASLVNGDAVAFFPEGLWLYEGHKLRKAYPGIEAIAKQYKKLTGKDLPIVPVGITDTAIKVAQPMALGKDQTVHDVMKEVARCLPETARGYYAETP